MKTLLIMLVMLCCNAQAQYVDKDGIIHSEPLPTKKAGTTKTTGYIDGKPVYLKTKKASDKTTTGWVDGRYVRIKEVKKDD